MDGNGTVEGTTEKVSGKVPAGEYVELHTVTKECDTRYLVRCVQPKAMSYARLRVRLLGAILLGHDLL